MKEPTNDRLIITTTIIINICHFSSGINRIEINVSGKLLQKAPNQIILFLCDYADMHRCLQRSQHHIKGKQKMHAGSSEPRRLIQRGPSVITSTWQPKDLDSNESKLPFNFDGCFILESMPIDGGEKKVCAFRMEKL